MLKRRIIFDDYDTAANFWTLASWSCPEPEPVTDLVEVPGRIDGPLDFSTVLTDDISYNSRPLEVRLESSEGTRLERKARIDDMVNKLHGQRVKIWLPDDANRYLVGRLSVVMEYNDMAHAAVNVSAACEPWKYDNDEVVEFVPLCGKNLFNNNELKRGYISGATLSSIDTGIRAEWTGADFAYALLKVYPLEMLKGKKVTLSLNMQTEYNNTPQVRIGYASEDTTVRKSVAALSKSGSVAITVRPDSEKYTWLVLWVYSNNGTKISELTKGDYVDYTNLQLEIGGKATDYEPYTVVSPQLISLTNDRRPVCPTITVQGEVSVLHNGASYALSDGVYKLPDILLKAGATPLQVSGTGAVAFTYRKAVL
jgi:hypothetical protein